MEGVFFFFSDQWSWSFVLGETPADLFYFIILVCIIEWTTVCLVVNAQLHLFFNFLANLD